MKVKKWLVLYLTIKESLARRNSVVGLVRALFLTVLTTIYCGSQGSPLQLLRLFPHLAIWSPRHLKLKWMAEGQYYIYDLSPFFIHLDVELGLQLSCWLNDDAKGRGAALRGAPPPSCCVMGS